MSEKIQDFLAVAASGLGKLGARHLIALGLVGITLVAAILMSSFYLTRPTYETLYVGLSRDDVNRMGSALGEAGIAFDVTSDGSSVHVPVGMAEKARMFLAEKGLPTSNNAGYELFDKMGSLGLTSFMQEVTRQRALEGEIARTIQAVQGVKAARVHIVLPDKGSFRRANQKPTASVVIRSDASFRLESAQAISQLVAAAVPSLEIGSVTVLDTAGQVLTSATDSTNATSMMMASLESQLATRIDENLRRQLTPYLGVEHFQTSVQVELDTDRRQMNETIFDPESQVARSVRTMRDMGDSQNSRNSDAVGVEQNIPQEEIASSGGENSTDKRDRREEITNYEISSKTIATVSDGYQVKKLSVAVVVDKTRLLSSTLTQGQDTSNSPDAAPPSQEQMDAELERIRHMVAAAAGLDATRGDLVNVTAVDFVGMNEDDSAPVEPGFMQLAAPFVPSMLSGAALIIAVLLVLFLGVRPLMRDMRTSAQTAENLPALAAGQEETLKLQNSTYGANQPALEDLRQRMRVPPQARLEKMMDIDEERFAAVLRDWIHEHKEPKAA